MTERVRWAGPAALLLLASCAASDREHEMTSNEEPSGPICSLSATDLEDRLGEIGALVDEHCRAIEDTEDGLLMRFEDGAEVRRRVLEIVEKERECCSSIAWQVDEPVDGTFDVRITGERDFVRSLLDSVRAPR